MSLNDTPRAARVHIGFFGRKNSGKSSLINAVTGQDLAVVSPIGGTTTDPVYKSMELLPLGPVVVIDTPGLDDDGELGSLRVKKARQVMNKADLALLVVDGTVGLNDDDRELQALLTEKKIPFITVMTKADLAQSAGESEDENVMWVSAKTSVGINGLKERLARLMPEDTDVQRLVGDLISPFDFVVLVIPIDKSAPKGRLILPQQQTIRDILESGATAITVRDTELKQTLESLGSRPTLVITDSQVFAKANTDTPMDIPLTSFSILFARYKGDLETAVAGAAALDRIRDGDKILVAEGCTHHRQCEDIGTVKLPKLINRHTRKQLEYVFMSGSEYPEELSQFNLIAHCGGCMLNTREMKYRVAQAKDQGIPISNYGILIAHTQGILKRSVEIFPGMTDLLGS